MQRKLQRSSMQILTQPERDRTLNKLKVGGQSTAGKAVDAFIKELKHQSSHPQMSDTLVDKEMQ
ncbi:hypothetical protein [Nostoc sp. ChiSLP03a]|uniref:hypothetical protein n=1 Tax=Nostoc sp. ChiSLP03a TaxID=3075380 RepID=UPI002AD931D3|nr:hypothetical protein [Nostoc sp. ChiSLP03a]